jgi:hypothetical protein
VLDHRREVAAAASLSHRREIVDGVAATQTLLVAAWIVAIVGFRSQPVAILIGLASIIGGALLILAFIFRPDAVPAYTDILAPKTTLLFSAEDGDGIPQIQIGESGVFLKNSAIGPLLLPVLEASECKVEAIEGAIKISTRIIDGSGNLIAHITRNEWKVSPTSAGRELFRQCARS